MDINQVITAIGIVCAAIIALGGAASVLRKWVAPIAALRESVEKLQQHIEEMDDDYKDLNKSMTLVIKGMMSLMDNAITGNSVDKIKEARDALQNHLIKR